VSLPVTRKTPFVRLGFRQRDALDSLSCGGRLSVQGISDDCGMPYWSAWTALEALRAHKLVERTGRAFLCTGSLPWEYEITAAGVLELERRKRIGLEPGVQTAGDEHPRRNRYPEEESTLANRIRVALAGGRSATTIELAEELGKGIGYVRNVLCAMKAAGELSRRGSCRAPRYRLKAASPPAVQPELPR
jgi:hypothetical protein